MRVAAATRSHLDTFENLANSDYVLTDRRTGVLYRVRGARPDGRLAQRNESSVQAAGKTGSLVTQTLNLGERFVCVTTCDSIRLR